MAEQSAPSTPRSSQLACLEGIVGGTLMSPLTPTRRASAQFSPDLVYSTPLTVRTYQNNKVIIKIFAFGQPQFGNPGPATPLALKHERFLAIAARAYQEAVKLPEKPPPAVWAPNDTMHSYYEWLLYRFGVELRSNLQRQGIHDDLIIRNEWLRHGRSITDNIRAEWGSHPLGSTAAVKTTLKTEYTEAAVLAVEAAVRSPTIPPPEGWEVGDDLHPYYSTMLRRFRSHMRDMLEKYGAGIFQNRTEANNAVGSYEEYIIREYRKTWIQMFGLPDLQIYVEDDDEVC
ncbi:hypothetical protein PRK78_005601 [Emydomyces testavorans]|uniref:Uncharacterized protein n=1 Tax=Emydomyces testavorans TaxID=2070801 RepID=A0AAF0IKV7_9EURO|nr:hypothetical protein PRK78_005601 [Emydomyces testavorans]